MPDAREEVIHLSGKVAELYQDVRIGDDLVVGGVRECRRRSALILPELAGFRNILDVGSGFGYFARAIARRYPDSTVVSVERDPDSTALQRKLLEIENPGNVILVGGEISRPWLRDAVAAGIRFDAVLLLSVLHHFPPADVEEMVENFGRLAPNLIFELPHHAEVAACGASTRSALARPGVLETLLPRHRDRRRLGSAPSHLDSGHRDIVLYRTETRARGGDDSQSGISLSELRLIGPLLWPPEADARNWPATVHV